MGRFWIMILAIVGSWASSYSALEASHSVVVVEEIDGAPSCHHPRSPNVKKLHAIEKHDRHRSSKASHRALAKPRTGPNTSISQALPESMLVQQEVPVIAEQPRKPNFLVRLVQKIGDEPSQLHFLISLSVLAPMSCLLEAETLGRWCGAYGAECVLADIALKGAITLLAIHTFVQIRALSQKSK